jgi:membrane-bound lytic murein transglycosylase D
MKSTPPVTIRVSVERGKAEKAEFSFSGPFRIGRDPECEVRLLDSKVSRIHAEVRSSEGKWCLFDLRSTNGIIIDGRREELIILSNKTKVELGQNGPMLSFSIQDTEQRQEPRAQDLSLDHYMKHYFDDRHQDDVGEHTMMIRTLHGKLQKKQKRRFQLVIAVLVCLFLGAGIYAGYKHFEISQQKALAEDIFYAIKSQELEFADLLRAARQSGDSQSLEYVKRYQARRAELEKKYDEFIKGLDVYGKKNSPEDLVILSIARTFGECEVAMPPAFVKEVLNYIGKWKSTQRLDRALEQARKSGYIEKIAQILQANGLPPQFMYLALQESNFNVNACGPPTAYGIAKGMWQFIPTTARSYGLRTGPLAELQQADPEDERHDFLKSTRAAAEYLRYIYDTEAQASGLLVMASYNWGENRVIKLIKAMPENPKERNFWCFLSKYRGSIPQETYDYVFYIISAAVIGENPKLFGFNFPNPLAQFEK